MIATTAIDLDAHYTVEGYRGIAWYLVGFDTEWTEEKWTFIGSDEDDTEDETNYVYDEPEEIENRERVRAVMVGDDRVFTFNVDEEDYAD
jgi:hypothetical protein